MNLTFLEEPELEFGAGRHIDIRFGIMNYGPLDFDLPVAPKNINVGIIGGKESVEGVRQWLERCRTEILAKPGKGDPDKPNKQPNLFTRFPGFSADRGFCSTLVMDDTLCRDFSSTNIAAIGKLPNRNSRIARSVDLYMEEIQYLAQNTDAKVIVCAVPIALLEAMGPEEVDDEDTEEGEETDPGVTSQLDFHDMLKARAMQQYRKPIQIILPSTYDDSKHRQQSKNGRRRELQDEATRAWNIHTALYYKAEGVPWRLPRASTDLTVCYIGVSFYKSLDKHALLTSVAQVFNQRGEGVVVRGGAAIISKDDRQAHLSEQHACDLLREALARYWEVHKTFPARVVIHKSSRFDTNEEKGFGEALKEKGIATHDLLWISSSATKLYRAGKYPPLRGTLLTLDDREMVLYTRGSVDFFETYPGMYVPSPLRIRLAKAEQTQQFLAREILALSKMNWNNTQFDGAEPVTLRASRNCSSVLRYCSEGRQIEPRYSFYM
jgi:hypothetical protein